MRRYARKLWGRSCAAAVVLLAVPVAGLAHHSTFGYYEMGRAVEIEGVITTVRWRNPHPSYTVEVTEPDGTTVEWQVETGAISALRLRGLGQDFMQVGDRVRLAGEPSVRGRPELFARNLLRPDGREVLISASSRPRWSADDPSRLYQPPPDESAAAEARANARGIFRAWSSVLGDTASFPLYGAGEYPLTPAAARLKADWDPATSPYVGCGRKGMPYVMATPYPLEFVAQGEDIVIRFEEFGAERTIRMDVATVPPAEPYSPLGFSRGRFEGDTLVVETERIDSPHFYGDGTPQSRAIRTLERFTISADESRLDYVLRVDDPETFTRPLEFTRYWAWRPEIRVQPFGCEQ